MLTKVKREDIVEMIIKVLTGIFLVGLTITGIAICMALPLMWAWNYVVPTLFGLSEIGFWQAFALHWVAGALIKSTVTSSGTK